MRGRIVTLFLVFVTGTACGSLLDVSAEPEEPIAAAGDDAGVAPPLGEPGSADASAPTCDGAIDCPRIAFVTRATWTGVGIGGLGGADAKCRAAAQAADVSPAVRGRAFVAWLSDAAKAASQRHVAGSKAYRLANATKIADDWKELTSGVLDAPIAIDEAGGLLANEAVWTGTNDNGSAAEHCSDWSDADGFATAGFTSGTLPGSWTNNGGVRSCRNVQGHLYCIER